ncbi:MAG: DUF305 domain-containing protein [Nocardioides sp.]
MTRRVRVVAILAAAAIALAGCTGSDEPGGSGDAHNKADVAFAQEMIPHHLQAVMMAEMVQRRGASDQLEDLAERIEEAQEAEIDQMAEWLDDWDEDAFVGHMRGKGGMGMSRGWGGMMRPRGDSQRFERIWLRAMIEHHEDALDMTREERAEGDFGPLVALATAMEAVQRAEIAEMEQLLSPGPVRQQGALDG